MADLHEGGNIKGKCVPNAGFSFINSQNKTETIKKESEIQRHLGMQ